jgi:hypothetical protein
MIENKKDPSSDNTPTDDTQKPILSLDDLDAGQDPETSMTLQEMQQAIDDESHPLHKEALQQSKKLADTMTTALEALKRQTSIHLDLTSQLQALHLPTPQELSLDNLTNYLNIGTTPKIPPIHEVNLSTEHNVPTAPIYRPTVADQFDFEEELEKIAEARREREAREESQFEMSAAQLETLNTMAANLQQLNHQMEKVHQRLSESNQGDDTSFKWTITIGALTLAATIISIIATIALSQL